MYDEGDQFILEDNLLNYLLTENENSHCQPSQEWLISSIRKFYIATMNISYIPYHIEAHLQEILTIFEKKSKHKFSQSNAFSKSFVPLKHVQEVSPKKLPPLEVVSEKSA